LHDEYLACREYTAGRRANVVKLLIGQWRGSPAAKYIKQKTLRLCDLRVLNMLANACRTSRSLRSGRLDNNGDAHTNGGEGGYLI
jgi:hypothetical protein